MDKAEVARWLALINLSLEERKRKQPNWEKLLEYYKGLQWERDDDGNDIITVNMVASSIIVTIPAIYARNPYIYMAPRTPASVKKARVAEVVLNRDLDKMDFKAEMKLAILDALIFGSAFFKTTYFMEFDQEEETVDDDLAQFRGVDLTPEIKEHGCRCIRVSPFDMAWTPGAKDWKKGLGFIAHRNRKRTMEIKNDPHYQNTKDLDSTVRVEETIRNSFTSFTDDLDAATGCNDIWEVWDQDTGKIFVLAEDYDKALKEPYDHPYPYPHPFDRLAFVEIPDEIRGLSPLDIWICQQDELNKMRTYQLGHIRRFGRKYAVKQGTLADEEDKLRLESGKDGVVLETTIDADKAVAVIQDANLPPDFYAWSATIKDDIVELSRVTPYKRGNVKGAKTATEASIVEQSSDEQDDDRVDIVRDVIKKITKKMTLCRKEFTPTQEIVDITQDMSSQKVWELWDKDTFDLEADFEIDYGSTLPHNRETEMQRVSALYDRLIQNPTFNPMALGVMLAEAYGQRDITQLLLPPEIIEQQIAMKAMADMGGTQGQKGTSATAGQGVPPETPEQEPAAGVEAARQLGASKGGAPPQLGMVQGGQ